MSLFPAKERSASFLHTIMKKEKVPPKTLCHHHLGFFFSDSISLSVFLTPCLVAHLLSHPLTFNSCPPSPSPVSPLDHGDKPIAVAVMQHSWQS